jgi:hypothetical protein
MQDTIVLQRRKISHGGELDVTIRNEALSHCRVAIFPAYQRRPLRWAGVLHRLR